MALFALFAAFLIMKIANHHAARAEMIEQVLDLEVRLRVRVLAARQHARHCLNCIPTLKGHVNVSLGLLVVTQAGIETHEPSLSN